MSNPDPGYVALADQFQAAEVEAAQVFDNPPGAIRDRAVLDGAPDWVRPFLDRHNQLVEQPHPQCVHLLGRGPTVIHVAVWAAGFVCCSACAQAGLLATRVPAGEELRCDVCHTDVPDELSDGRLRSGHAIVHFAICDDCDPATGPTVRNPT